MTDVARWAQLTYASIPGDGASDAGWRIKQATGDPTPAEMEQLLARVVTRFESHTPFPSLGEEAAVYERLPRRFGHVETSGGDGIYWHASQVDKDGFGRTGNVFNHLVLDRRPGDPEPIRPVTWWRSPDLVAPHWYNRVAESNIGASHPAPGLAVTTSTVLDFLFDPAHWQRALFLPVLIDAVFAAMADPAAPHVVLKIDDSPEGWQEEAAQWIGAISFTLSPRDARRLSFSLYERGVSERGASAAAALARDLHLAVVPATDEISDADAVSVLTPSDTQGATGGYHETTGGRPVAVGRASQLVGRTMSWRDGAEAQFAAIDEIAARIGAVPTADPAWALAMSIAQQSPENVPLEAVEIIATATPRAVAGVYALRRTVDDVVDTAIGDDLGSIEASVRNIPSDTYTYDLFARAYLKKAAGDPAWLIRPAGVPIPNPLPDDLGGYRAVVDAALASALEAEPGDAASIVRQLRLVDLVARTLPPEGDAAATGSRAAALGEIVIAELFHDPDLRGEVLNRVGWVAPETVERFVTPAVRAELSSRSSTPTILAAEPQPRVALDRSLAPTSPSSSVFTVPRDMIDFFYAERPPQPLTEGADRLSRDVRIRLAERTSASAGYLGASETQELAAEFLSDYGDWQSIPDDAKQLIGPSAAAWTSAQLLEVVDRATVMRSRINASSTDRPRGLGMGATVRVPAELAWSVLMRPDGDGRLRELIQRTRLDDSAEPRLRELATARGMSLDVLAADPEDEPQRHRDGESVRLTYLGITFSQDGAPWAVAPIIALTTSLAAVLEPRRLNARNDRARIVDVLARGGRDAAAVAASRRYLDARARDAPSGRGFALGIAVLALAGAGVRPPANETDVVGAVSALLLPRSERLVDAVARDALAHWTSVGVPVSRDDIYEQAQMRGMNWGTADLDIRRRETDKWWKQYGPKESSSLRKLGKNLFSGGKAGGDA